MVNDELPKAGTSVPIRVDRKGAVSRNTKMPVGRGSIDGTSYTVSFSEAGDLVVKFVSRGEFTLQYVALHKDFVHLAYHSYRVELECEKAQRESDSWTMRIFPKKPEEGDSGGGSLAI